MAVKIIEKCDGCSKSRELELERVTGKLTVYEASVMDGWREVANDKHLCPACIKKAIKT